MAGERGFVHDVAKRVYGGMFAGDTAYLCGPPPMIEACIATLMQGRLFEKHIFTERFLTAKDCAEAESPCSRGSDDGGRKVSRSRSRAMASRSGFPQSVCWWRWSARRDSGS